MSQNLYDTANILERELRQSAELKALQAALKAVYADKESKEQFESFKAISVKFQTMQLSGQQPTEEDMKEAQEAAKKAQANALIANLMKVEQAMSVLMEDLNRIITKPLAEVYQEQ